LIIFFDAGSAAAEAVEQGNGTPAVRTKSDCATKLAADLISAKNHDHDFRRGSNLVNRLIKIDRRTCIWLVVLSVIIGGLRFSDGSFLLAIASGKTPLDPPFGRWSQYIWDSPLKVFILRLLPANIISIAVAFAGLAALPLTGLAATENSLLFYLTGVLIFVTPAIRVSFQNIGLGDGLLYILVLLSVVSESALATFVSFLLIGLWHPQQAFFVGLSALIYGYVYDPKGFRRYLKWGVSGLVIAAISFYLYRQGLSFTYYDRFDYTASRLHEVAGKNLVALPVAAIYLVFWVYLVKRRLPDVKLPLYAKCWLLALVGVSVLTADVTRVLSIIALPILLIPMKRLYLASSYPDRDPNLRFPLTWMVASLLVPVYSWSGFDIFVWPYLLRALCKYKVVCLL
jgi:hypothetical protein